MLCSTTYGYFIDNFLDAVQKISVKFSGGYFSDTLLAEESLEMLKRKRPIETPEAPNVPQSESSRRRGLGQSKTY